MNDDLIIAGKRFRSRLILGTGKYASPEACRAALDADDRACLRSCRTRGGPYLNITDY